MRVEETLRPSFPPAPTDVPLGFAPGVRWQVVCGDAGHWRAGIYAPAEARIEDVTELERHDCPELFLLIQGRMTLVLADGTGVRELPLEPGRPVLVESPHSAYCPDGPHTGVAFVVERDAFLTELAPVEAWGRQDRRGGEAE